MHEVVSADTSLGEPDRSCVVWGPVAWDSCECGQLTVSTGRQYPSSSFPMEGPININAAQSKCGTPYIGVPLTITLLRCVPTSDINGNPPDCGALSESALHLSEDATAMRRAAVCCLTELKKTYEIEDWMVQSIMPVGPAGGCGGSQLDVVVAIMNKTCGC